MRLFNLFIIAIIINSCVPIELDRVYYMDDPSYYGVRDGRIATFYIKDSDGYGIEDLEVFCERLPKQYTTYSGAFKFYGNSECVVNIPWEYAQLYIGIRLEDSEGRAVAGVWYECISGEGGFTNIYGEFQYKYDYTQSDSCRFRF